jgi:hypothetical protein
MRSTLSPIANGLLVWLWVVVGVKANTKFWRARNKHEIGWFFLESFITVSRDLWAIANQQLYILLTWLRSLVDVYFSQSPV